MVAEWGIGGGARRRIRENGEARRGGRGGREYGMGPARWGGQRRGMRRREMGMQDVRNRTR